MSKIDLLFGLMEEIGYQKNERRLREHEIKKQQMQSSNSFQRSNPTPQNDLVLNYERQIEALKLQIVDLETQVVRKDARINALESELVSAKKSTSNTKESVEKTQNVDSVRLTTGTWICGEDIEPGRYTAKALGTTSFMGGFLKISGSIDIRQSLGDSSGSEILKEAFGDYGGTFGKAFGDEVINMSKAVPSVTFTIRKNDVIEITDMAAAIFEKRVTNTATQSNAVPQNDSDPQKKSAGSRRMDF